MTQIGDTTTLIRRADMLRRAIADIPDPERAGYETHDGAEEGPTGYAVSALVSAYDSIAKLLPKAIEPKRSDLGDVAVSPAGRSYECRQCRGTGDYPPTMRCRRCQGTGVAQ